MAVSYNRLFKLMIDRKMRKKDLCELAGVSTSTMSKMGRDEIVSLEVIDRICQKLNCNVEDAPYCFMGSCFIFSSISHFSSSVT